MHKVGSSEKKEANPITKTKSSAKTGKMEFLPFHVENLTSWMVERAEKELHETPEIKKEALQKFRKLLKDDKKYIYCCGMDDEYLLQFLRARKFNVNGAQSLIRNYYYIKNHNNDIYKPDFESYRVCALEEILNMLPYRDEEGSIICVFKLCNWDFTKMKFSSIVHGISVALISCVDTQPVTQICGVKVIVDTKGLGMKLIQYISISEIQVIAKGLTNSLPIRFKAVHVVNEAAFMKYCWSVLKFVLSDKMKKRFQFHGTNMESLHKEINPALLPKEYGGSLDYDNSFWIQTIDNSKARYHELMSHYLKSRRASSDDS